MPQSKNLQNNDLSKITTIPQLIKAVTLWGHNTKERMKFEFETNYKDNSFIKLFGQIKELCIKDLEVSEFLDIYIQTAICISFIIKVTYKSKYSIDDLLTAFPNLHPLLISLIQRIIHHADPNFVQLATLFNKCDSETILENFTGLKTETEVTSYFYELLLKEFNPNLKTKTGIFYTPTPVVAFIVRSINYLLRTELNCHDELEDDKTRILDPAMGTGVFLESAIHAIKSIFDEKQRTLNTADLNLKWNKYVDECLLNRLCGLELELPSYLIAQIKLNFLLKDTGINSSSKRYIPLFLVNTLNPDKSLSNLPDSDWFTLKNDSGNKIADSRLIPVILGNPPYSRSSKNTGKYIDTLMTSYKSAVQHEKNIQPLSDDYIKFIRFAQDRIEKTGHGIIGMITNHTFLTGIIYRGMRQELMKVFDRIYLLDLHGSKIIHENAPNEVKDENIFPIKQGICIVFFVKNSSLPKKKVFHFDLFGSKIFKLEWLNKNEIATIHWTDLSDITPGSPFSPQIRIENNSSYASYPCLTELFQFYNVGGKPGDDNLLVAFGPGELSRKMDDFLLKIAEKGENFENTEAKRKLLKVLDQFSFDSKKIEQYNYRPFDVRWVYYDSTIWTRPVTKLKMQCTDNILLLCSRIVKDGSFSHVFISNLFTDVIFLSNTSSVNCYVFPLLKKDESGDFTWNLSHLYLNYLTNMGINLNNKNSLDPLAYIYAILFSNRFRARYSENLKRDFPRIPLIQNPKVVYNLIQVGIKLMKFHLFQADSELGSEVRTNITIDDKIQKRYPQYRNEYVYISSKKWFHGISSEVWNFCIGKYQVCYKWLKDRENHFLSDEEIIQYQKIICVLKATIPLMRTIDEILESTDHIAFKPSGEVI